MQTRSVFYRVSFTFLVLAVAEQLLAANNHTAQSAKSQKGDANSSGLIGNKGQKKDGNAANKTNHKRYNITSKDDRFEYILKIPTRRPFTPIQTNGNRSLYPVRILLGQSLCIYRKFIHFFSEAADRNISPYALLMNATATIRDQDYYFYDAEDLCINIDDDLNVDIWKYDCSPKGVCVCGLYFSYVDIGIPPRIDNGQLKYLQVNGLDRKLIVEDGECKSGLKGHCSLLKNNTAYKRPLMCGHSYECILDDTYGPIITNAKTEQIYGRCLPKKVRGLQRKRFYHSDDGVPKNHAIVIKSISLGRFAFLFWLSLYF